MGKEASPHAASLSPAPLATGQLLGVVKDLSIRTKASDSQKCSEQSQGLAAGLAALDTPVNYFLLF